MDLFYNANTVKEPDILAVFIIDLKAMSKSSEYVYFYLILSNFQILVHHCYHQKFDILMTWCKDVVFWWSNVWLFHFLFMGIGVRGGGRKHLLFWTSVYFSPGAAFFLNEKIIFLGVYFIYLSSFSIYGILFISIIQKSHRIGITLTNYLLLQFSGNLNRI